MDAFKARYYGIPVIYGGEAFRRLAEKEAILIQVSGFDVEKLIELFAAGYTLQPPERHITLESFYDFAEN